MGSPPSLFGAAVELTVAGNVWGEKEVEVGGAGGACKSCILHPWQRSGVIRFCIHLTAVSDSVVDPGLIKTSGI